MFLFFELPNNILMIGGIIHPVLLKVSLEVHNSCSWPLKKYRIVSGLVIMISFVTDFSCYALDRPDVMPLTQQGNYNSQRELKSATVCLKCILWHHYSLTY